MCGCFSAHRISGRLRLRTAPSSRTSVFLTDEQIKGRKTASKHGGKHTHKRTKQILRSTCRVSALLLGSRAPERNISSQRVQREYTQHVHLCVCECVCGYIYIHTQFICFLFCATRTRSRRASRKDGIGVFVHRADAYLSSSHRTVFAHRETGSAERSGVAGRLLFLSEPFCPGRGRSRTGAVSLTAPVIY